MPPIKDFLSCKKCKKSYPMPRNGEISIFDDKTCPLCGNYVIKVSNIEKRTNYKICPSCYNVPPRQTETLAVQTCVVLIAVMVRVLWPVGCKL